MGCRGSKQRSLGDEAVSPRSQATFFSVIVGVDDVRDVNIQTDDAQNDETYNLSYHTADGANEASCFAPSLRPQLKHVLGFCHVGS